MYESNSADEYNLHGAKRLFTIPNVLSASRPSVNQDGENKPFLHIDCFSCLSIVFTRGGRFRNELNTYADVTETDVEH